MTVDLIYLDLSVMQYLVAILNQCGLVLNQYKRKPRLILKAGEGRFTALKLFRHAVTNIDVIQRFLPVCFGIEERNGYSEVRVGKLKRAFV